MPAGILPKDLNWISAIGGTSSATDTGASIKPFQHNPTTRGLTVHVVGSDLSGQGVTGVGHGVKTVTTAGTDVVLAPSTACKKVDIQAQTDNTGVIAVGAIGVDATVATGTGIILNAGDVYSLEIDNLADIFIDATVSTDGVRFTYYV